MRKQGEQGWPLSDLIHIENSRQNTFKTDNTILAWKIKKKMPGTMSSSKAIIKKEGKTDILAHEDRVWVLLQIKGPKNDKISKK
jgi:hypothetical protein